MYHSFWDTLYSDCAQVGGGVSAMLSSTYWVEYTPTSWWWIIGLDIVNRFLFFF